MYIGNPIRNNAIKRPLTIAIAIAINTFSSSSLAVEEKTSHNETEIETIQISGFASSIKKSMNEKRFSNEIKDVIAAEDIGQFTDQNLAESMQRITGVQMERGGDGEGTTIQIRGISANNVEMNGQTLSGTGASRAIDFQDIPSELFSSIEVLKTPTADKIEGSLGGTVNLVTAKPLNRKEDILFVANAKSQYSELSEKIDPDLNVTYGQNFKDTKLGDFGFQLVASYRQINTRREQQSNSWRRMQNTAIVSDGGTILEDGETGYFGKTLLLDLNDDGKIDNDDNYIAPSGFGIRTDERTSDRSAFQLSTQWQPNDSFNMYIDSNYTLREDFVRGALANLIITGNGRLVCGGLTGCSDSIMLGSNDVNAGADGILGNDDDMVISGNKVLLKGSLSGGNPRFGGAPNIREEENPTYTWTIGADYSLGDNITIEGNLSSSNGEKTLQTVQSNMGFDWNNDGLMNARDHGNLMVFNHDNGADLPDLAMYETRPNLVDLTGLNLSGTGQQINIAQTDNPNMRIFQIIRTAQEISTSSNAAQLDFEYRLDDSFITSLKAGVRFAEREFTNKQWRDRNQSVSQRIEEGELTVVNPDGIRVHVTDPRARGCLSPSTDFGTILSEYSGDFPREFAYSACDTKYVEQQFNMEHVYSDQFFEQPSTYTVTEKTKAIYAMGNFELNIGIPLIGNLGARYVETDTTSVGTTGISTLIDAERCSILQDDPATPPLDGDEEACKVDSSIPTVFENLSFPGGYDNLLPSMNLNFLISDKLIFRIGANKVLQRPGLTAIRPAANYNFGGFTGSRGNPNLKAIEATNIDLSLEWYYSKSSMFSAALFEKDLKNGIIGGVVEERFQCCVFQMNTRENGPGTKINGIELGLNHAFDNLDNFFRYTGLNMNYTYTKEDGKTYDYESDAVPREGLSENSYNLMAYYDDNTFSFRLAYNYRDKFVITSLSGAGVQLPVYQEARGQLDLSSGYNISNDLKVNFSIQNLNNSDANTFQKYQEIRGSTNANGRRFALGLRYKF